jgi:hypothetical protein
MQDQGLKAPQAPETALGPLFRLAHGSSVLNGPGWARLTPLLRSSADVQKAAACKKGSMPPRATSCRPGRPRKPTPASSFATPPAGTWLLLLRGRARSALGGQPPHPRRGPAHCRQHRQAARAAAVAPILTVHSTRETPFATAPPSCYTSVGSSERHPAPAVTNDPRPRANISVEPKSGLDLSSKIYP